jgi:N-acetylmuramic acid 6-phosphate etherase
MKSDDVPGTEAPNPRTSAIDTLSSLEIVTMINEEDARVAGAVHDQLPEIARAVDAIVDRLQRGGHLFYFGAGTSGRLGVLDASEMPPTFSVPPSLVQGWIAGGDGALRRSAEAAEDDAAGGAQVAREADVGEADVLVAIALTCNPDAPLARAAEIAIVPVVGPEVIAGSSRMKAGTAQKMVLNMLSTATMIRLGKVYGNLMVDVRPTNSKLRHRAAHILQQAAGVDAETARAALEETGYEVKPALVMLLSGVDVGEARRRLDQVGGLVRRAIAPIVLPPTTDYRTRNEAS